MTHVFYPHLIFAQTLIFQLTVSINYYFMNKRQTINLGGFICLVVASYFIYYLLLQDKILPFSIGAVMSSINHWVSHKHIIVTGLLPVYVALMLSGAAVLGIYLGSLLQRWITYFFSHDS